MYSQTPLIRTLWFPGKIVRMAEQSGLRIRPLVLTLAARGTMVETTILPPFDNVVNYRYSIGCTVFEFGNIYNMTVINRRRFHDFISFNK